MPFEIILGLRVTDQAKYGQYRTEIAPLLAAAGAGFRYDFEIARTLKSETALEINRVFVIQFPDHTAKDAFFADPQYREIRSRLYDKAVGETVVIAEYTR